VESRTIVSHRREDGYELRIGGPCVAGSRYVDDLEYMNDGSLRPEKFRRHDFGALTSIPLHTSELF